jgi:L-threonylcarbamoyladenylate synthase
MSRILDCTELADRPQRIRSATAALRRGDVGVVPDQSMYTLVCDAFSRTGVDAIRSIKGNSSHPLSILVGKPVTTDGVASNIPKYARDLMSAFWPGPLTLLLRQQPSLSWPLSSPGVAVRMPLHPVMLDLVRELGPTAATAANNPGFPPVRTPAEFEEQLAADVDLFLDSGPISDTGRSTVVDATGQFPVVRREGSISADAVVEVCAEVMPEGS